MELWRGRSFVDTRNNKRDGKAYLNLSDRDQRVPFAPYHRVCGEVPAFPSSPNNVQSPYREHKECG